jgi:thiol:disulfide interchange protein DsbA
MRRRRFLKTASLALALTMTHAVQALDEKEIEGMYRTLAPQAVQDPKRVEVLEVFWYRCPHCYAFQPHVESYVAGLPDYVNFRRMPAVLRDSWIPQTKTFYAAEALGVLKTLHKPIFDAIHQKRRPMSSRSDIKSFFVEHGVDGARFDAVFDSFSLDAQVRQANAQTRRYGLTGVPTVIVNGRYRTSGQLAGSYETMVEVIKTLVEKERKRIGQ